MTSLNSQKVVLNKLVRDKIIDIIKQDNRTPHYKTLKGPDLLNALNNKLDEEISEYKDASTLSHKIEELADITEVIFALLQQLNISQDDFFNIMEQKRTKNGGFAQGLFLESFEENQP